MRGIIFATILIGMASLAKGAETVTIEAADGARQPQIAVDESGRVHLTFGIGNSLYYTSSFDRGATFRPPTEVAQLKHLALGMRRGPRIAITGNSVIIAAIGSLKSGGDDGNLFTWRSQDIGRTWHGPVRVNNVGSSAREGLHALAGATNGELFCVWLDLRNKGTQIFGSRSSDGGARWSENLLIYKSPDGSVCECCHPSTVYDSDGTLYVMWRNSLAGNRDMYLATSRDGGRSFASAAKLGSKNWLLKACPMDGGAVAVGVAGEFATVWRRDRDIFLTQYRLVPEQRLGMGQQPWIAADKNGVYAVWVENRDEKLLLARNSGDLLTELARTAHWPVVSASPSGQGPVVVAWEAEDQGRHVIKTRVVNAPQ